MFKINIIGAGLAGSECALYLAKRGHVVNLFDIKGEKFTPAHHSKNYAEIVCSNSLKSMDKTTASGVLKNELTQLGCNLLKIAYNHSVPAGQALAVDREAFSADVTEKLKNNKNINIFTQEVDEFDTDAITIIATGPLTTPKMCEALKKEIGADFLYFYDAAAPIISADSIDMNKAFFYSRYNKGGEDYLNCAMNKEEYTRFYNALISAETVELHEFEKKNIFESCMPIEIMARRGEDSIRFGPLKPVGITNPHNNLKPYAVVQLRKENECATMYNMVGFQTNLTFSAQREVFRLIPGLENAEFLRYGIMHTNNYVNFPNCLDKFSRLKNNPNIFIAGQLSGVEGYVESIASGLYCAINVDRMLSGLSPISFSENTIIGGLYNYLTNADVKHFQPINANFGLLPQIKEKDKKKKGEMYCLRSSEEMKKVIKEFGLNII